MIGLCYIRIGYKKGAFMIISSLPIIPNPSIDSSSIGMAVLAKSLDTVEISGQNMIKMMEQSITPNLGVNIDTRV